MIRISFSFDTPKEAIEVLGSLFGADSSIDAVSQNPIGFAPPEDDDEDD